MVQSSSGVSPVVVADPHEDLVAGRPLVVFEHPVRRLEGLRAQEARGVRDPAGGCRRTPGPASAPRARPASDRTTRTRARRQNRVMAPASRTSPSARVSAPACALKYGFSLKRLPKNPAMTTVGKLMRFVLKACAVSLKRRRSCVIRFSVPSSWTWRSRKFWVAFRSGYFSTTTIRRDRRRRQAVLRLLELRERLGVVRRMSPGVDLARPSRAPRSRP